MITPRAHQPWGVHRAIMVTLCIAPILSLRVGELANGAVEDPSPCRGGAGGEVLHHGGRRIARTVQSFPVPSVALSVSSVIPA